MATHVVIVGAYGSAGVAVAQSLAEDPSVRLTLIDDGDPGGGLCILRGCMPSKEVLSAAAHRYQARHDPRLSETPEVDLESVVDLKDDHVLGFAEHRRAAVHDLAEGENVEFIHDTARFVDDHTVEVGDRAIEADYVVIATGSKVNVPDLPGMDEVEYMTSADVLDATAFPDSGIVMGFGYTGLELVPYLSEAAGMDLTVIEHDPRPLDEGDAPFGDEILDMYREEFDVDILTETEERRVESTGDGVRLHVEQNGETKSIDADELILFTGRRPNLDGLGLEDTPLSPDEGWVEETMQARDDPRTFVVGDANGKEPILHVAKEQGFKAAENILAHVRGDDLEPYENVHHHVIFSGVGVYPFARVGLSEDAAEAEGREYVAVSRQASDDGVFKTKQASRGLAKLVVDAEDGTVIGYQGLHYHADVMAKTMQVVVERGMDVRDIPDRAYHPTTPEILDGLIRDASEKVGTDR
ncbi:MULTISPECIES: NAD(P)/FAD-dependent oxidoreductase [unclassified Haladaptatus]|uniref:dihydrolipoyl dehydrogenase family protein n=1 Tax=unclassified Haladaptatus TaxID=2622732 RepID=UPI00209C5718|nr:MULTISPECIES: NAD(P)/FAD-dependent oxidoreductase [unclassified Haladaptatus]MCO8244657.1 NAD(P)/FAD-dependent oxidoreductase [Haladaptatus sp. AB643]MCO8253721.1 NAD(P)/FAD-dependent oxidoreductase [Haladaptatus sp. AB618]